MQEESTYENLQKLRQTQSSLLLWDKIKQQWLPYQYKNELHKIEYCNNLSVFTLNVLKVTKQKLLFSSQRYQYILNQVQKLNPSIISFNEVTKPFNDLLLAKQWVKSNYWVSLFKPDKQQGMGNIIMSKIQPIFNDSIAVPKLTRIIETVFIPIKSNKNSHIYCFGSVHLTAFAWNKKTRENQLNQLMKYINRYSSKIKGLVLMGDMNFHSQEQNQLNIAHDLEDCWLKKYQIQDNPGYTFDAVQNRMINQIYWGFQKRRMRLDRIFIKGKLKVKQIAVTMKQPVQGDKEQFVSHGIIKGSLLFINDMIGLNYGRQNKQKYLYPSDHFGLLAELQII